MYNYSTPIRLLTTICCLLIFYSTLFCEDDYDWQYGPATVSIGNNLAQIDLTENFVFLNAKDSRDFMESIGNPSDGTERGTILPIIEGEDWFLIFMWNNIGYVSDDDKDDIDSDAILDAKIEANSIANKEREKLGFSPLIITGWYEEPYYDEDTHNLVWAISAESDGFPVINHDTRILGRKGVMSAIVVADPEQLPLALSKASELLKTFEYKSGNRYLEFIKGDKVAGYGLTALIAGGAGAAAAKLGLFAKLGKLIVKLWYVVIAGVVALFSRIKKMFGRFFNTSVD